MTSSNALTESAPALDGPTAATAETFQPSDGALPSPTFSSPFELLPAGETFGVCDVNGVCS